MTRPSRSKLSRLRRRATAIDQIRAARCALACALRDLLSARTIRCAPRCPGWVIGGGSGRARRCDECARLSGYEEEVTHEDLAMLPEVRRAHEATETSETPTDHPTDDETTHNHKAESLYARAEGGA